jgi:hypothetical protein
MLLIRLWRWREREREKKGNGQPTIFTEQTNKKKICVIKTVKSGLSSPATFTNF